MFLEHTLSFQNILLLFYLFLEEIDTFKCKDTNDQKSQ